MKLGPPLGKNPVSAPDCVKLSFVSHHRFKWEGLSVICIDDLHAQPQVLGTKYLERVVRLNLIVCLSPGWHKNMALKFQAINQVLVEEDLGARHILLHF